MLFFFIKKIIIIILNLSAIIIINKLFKFHEIIFEKTKKENKKSLKAKKHLFYNYFISEKLFILFNKKKKVKIND